MNTYCSQPPSLGSGRKERKHVTNVAPGTENPLLPQPVPHPLNCTFRDLEITAIGGWGIWGAPNQKLSKGQALPKRLKGLGHSKVALRLSIK